MLLELLAPLAILLDSVLVTLDTLVLHVISNVQVPTTVQVAFVKLAIVMLLDLLVPLAILSDNVLVTLDTLEPHVIYVSKFYLS